ncbi:unnamed protein product [Ectocarpus sp. CCAP 1310/34]|nr:unnamed protein product [Ectocarpus sp. CCAP 1310/34]
MSLSACRHALRHRGSIILLRHSSTAAALKQKPIAVITPAEGTISDARHAYNSSARWQQQAAAGQGEEGWTGGDGGERGGHAGARILGIAVFSSLVGATACLGTWQAMRYSWKLDLIESRRAKMELEPVDLPEGLEGAALATMMDVLDKEADGKASKGPNGETLGGSEEGKGLLGSLEGRRLRVTGVFDHGKEVLVAKQRITSVFSATAAYFPGPRGAPPGMKATSGPSSMAPSPMGDFVYTPLKRGDGSVVLVNRGWVSRSKGLQWSRPEGEVTMVGVLKAAEKRSTFSPDNKPETRHLLWAEKAALLQAAGLGRHGAGEGVQSVPILMEAVGEEDGDKKTMPMAKTPKHFGDFYVTPQTHLMYSATW